MKLTNYTDDIRQTTILTGAAVLGALLFTLKAVSDFAESIDDYRDDLDDYNEEREDEDSDEEYLAFMRKCCVSDVKDAVVSAIKAIAGGVACVCLSFKAIRYADAIIKDTHD